MTNHVHLGLVPETEDGLWKVLKPLHMRYAQEINSRQKWVGHLWQARFYSSPVDPEQVASVIRYILRNPVRAGIVSRAVEYQWSSAKALYTGERDEFLRFDSKWAAILETIRGIPGWLDTEEQTDELSRIRDAVCRDLPIGTADFIRTLEDRTGRFLTPRSAGRPPGSGTVKKK